MFYMAHVPVLCTAATADHRSDVGEYRRPVPAAGWWLGWLWAFIQTWVATTAAVEEALIRAGVGAGNRVAAARQDETPLGEAQVHPQAHRPCAWFLPRSSIAQKWVSPCPCRDGSRENWGLSWSDY